MSRDITHAAQSAITDGLVRVCLLFEAEFTGGTVYLWSGQGDLSWNGQTWLGGGSLLGVSEITETSDVVATGVTVTLSGVDPAYVAAAISEAGQGLPGRIWLGLIDDTGAVIVDPLALFSGRLDVPQITDGGATCAITISYESRLVNLLKPNEWRYTHESQQQLYPGDMAFEFVHQDSGQENPMGHLMRVDRWEIRLAEAIEAARHRPFQWGVHDCATWAMDVRFALTGDDMAADWRGRYRTANGAAKFMRKQGYADLREAAMDKLGAPLETVRLAQRGDVLLDPEGEALGICAGRIGLFLTEGGLTDRPLVECTHGVAGLRCRQ